MQVMPKVATRKLTNRVPVNHTTSWMSNGGRNLQFLSLDGRGKVRVKPSSLTTTKFCSFSKRSEGD